jgi:hypothetical protein
MKRTVDSGLLHGSTSSALAWWGWVLGLNLPQVCNARRTSLGLKAISSDVLSQRSERHVVVN